MKDNSNIIADESNHLSVLALIIALGIYYKDIVYDWDVAVVPILYYSMIYGFVIFFLGIISITFWIMALCFILTNFLKNDHINKEYNYRKSKCYLSLSLIFLLISSLLFYNANALSI